MSWRINTQPQLNILSGGLLVEHVFMSINVMISLELNSV